jgi:hypothetical protein
MSIRFFYSRVYSIRVFFYFGPARNDFLISVDYPESRRILFVQSTLIFACHSGPARFFGYIFSDVRSFKILFNSKILFDSGPSWNNLYFDSMIEPLRNGFYSLNLLSFVILSIIPSPARLFWLQFTDFSTVNSIVLILFDSRTVSEWFDFDRLPGTLWILFIRSISIFACHSDPARF